MKPTNSADREAPNPPQNFATTRWSRVLRIGENGEVDERHTELSDLCRDYWFPLYAFARRSGHSREDAEDLTQAFLVHLLEKIDFGKLSPERGRFRSFLLTSFRRFMIDDWRKHQAEKRGGGEFPVPLDEEEFEGRFEAIDDTASDPESIFDRTWAVALVDRVYERLGAEYRRAEKTALFDRLRECLLGDADRPYAELAEEVGMSEGGFTMAVHRLRRRFGEEIRAEIAETVSDESEVEGELRWFLSVFAGAKERE